MKVSNVVFHYADTVTGSVKC